MEKRFRDTATAARVQNSVDDTFFMLSMVDANKKRMKLPLVDDPDNSCFSLFHGYKADISMDRAFECLTYFALEHEFNDTSRRRWRNRTIAAGAVYMLYMVVTGHCVIEGNLDTTISPLNTINRDRL